MVSLAINLQGIFEEVGRHRHIVITADSCGNGKFPGMKEGNIHIAFRYGHI